MLVMVARWYRPWVWSGAHWAALTFVVLAVTALVALRQAREARKLREAQARPFVIVDFHPWNTFIDLTIKNIGSTLASDVRFVFEPQLTSTLDGRRERLAELTLFRDGIPSLPPGKEISTLFDQFPGRIQQGLPLTHTVEVSYHGATRRKPYTERIVLDLAMYVGTGRINRYGLDDIHRRLKEIADNVKRWTDSGGLKIVTTEDQRERARELMERSEARQKAHAEEGESGTTEPDSVA